MILTSVPAIPVRQPALFASAVLAIGLSPCALRAQSEASSKLRFDVASVKANRKADCRGRWDFSTSHGTLTAENAPLLRIISRAYNLTDDRVVGPGWLESQCYDIRAKASGNVPEGDLMRMLQSLLEERFHLVARRESDERPVYALVVDKGGSKIPPYGADVPVPSTVPDGKVLFMVRHVPDLCERLAKVAGRPVLDETGLTGDYRIVLIYSAFGVIDGDRSEPASDILSAVRDQLGLRLEAGRGTVEVVKVTSVNRAPEAN